MRKTIVLCGLGGLVIAGIVATVLAGTITSVTASVSNSSGDTTVSVTRHSNNTWTVTICKQGSCPTVQAASGEYWVKMGSDKVHFKRFSGGWKWRVKREDGSWGMSGYDDVSWRPKTVSGESWCCMSASGISDSTFGGNPAQAEAGPTETTYTLTFGIESGNTTTPDGTLTWTESNPQ